MFISTDSTVTVSVSNGQSCLLLLKSEVSKMSCLGGNFPCEVVVYSRIVG
jgi:hypothetical protein